MHRMQDQFSTRKTSQQQQIPGAGQVENNAGGFIYAVDDWVRLDRFLVLGSEGGSYYAAERPLTIENAEAVGRCIVEDGPRAVARIVDISEQGRAPKNDPALFALAMAAGSRELKTRRLALDALPRVARIGTHLFHFAAFVEGFRGWGRGLRRAVAGWYNGKPVDDLAYQAVKYMRRDGWSHRDLLRLSHPAAAPEDHGRRALYDWICRGDDMAADLIESLPPLVDAVRTVRHSNRAAAAEQIRRHRLPREVLPTDLLNSKSIWRALLQDMPMTAMIRNVGKMSAVGLLDPLSPGAEAVAAKLLQAETVRKARLHPLALLVAQSIYDQGHGVRGSLNWIANVQVLDALESAFYAAFAAIEPTDKRLLLALDVSGSMTFDNICGSPLTPRDGAAAMALVTMATERRCHVVGFTATGDGAWRPQESAKNTGKVKPDDQYIDSISPLPISPKQRLADVVAATDCLLFGNTDCALPMLYALDRGIEADAFVIYTDSETWSGDIHPVQALQQYRAQTGIAAKLVVVGMVSNGFSIADPGDGGMLDVVGFDTTAPGVIADFIRG